MKNSWSFGKKLNFRPIVLSLVAGVLVTILFLSFFKLYLAILFGVFAFMIVALYVYPNTLDLTFGYWKIDNDQIYYYDYSHWSNKIKAIFAPKSFLMSKIDFKDIENFSIVKGSHVIESKEIYGGQGYAPELFMPAMRTQYYILIRLRNGEDIKLDLSYNKPPEKRSGDYIKEAVQFMASKLEVNSNSIKIEKTDQSEAQFIH